MKPRRKNKLARTRSRLHDAVVGETTSRNACPLPPVGLKHVVHAASSRQVDPHLPWQTNDLLGRVLLVIVGPLHI